MESGDWKMEIEYSLNVPDLIALAEYQVEHSSATRQRFRTRRWIYPVAFAMIALGNYLLARDFLLPLVFAAFAVLSYILYPAYFQWFMQKRIKQIVRERMTPSSIASRKLRITADGLEQIMENAESKAGWQLVDAIETTPGYTFVAIEGTYSVIIPKDGLEGGSYDEFVAGMRRFAKASRADQIS